MTDINQAVSVEMRGHVMIVTINRPEARNAVNAHVHEGIGDALEAADADPVIPAVIITGAGDKAFWAGADLVALSRGESLALNDPLKQSWGFPGIVSHPISTPAIAAVNGHALGGGLEIALPCDLVVAVDDALFGLSEPKRGLFAAAGDVFRLGRQIPKKIAMEMMLTGDPISAERAGAGTDQRDRTARRVARHRAGAGRADHGQLAAIGSSVKAAGSGDSRRQGSARS